MAGDFVVKRSAVELKKAVEQVRPLLIMVDDVTLDDLFDLSEGLYKSVAFEMLARLDRKER